MDELETGKSTKWWFVKKIILIRFWMVWAANYAKHGSKDQIVTNSTSFTKVLKLLPSPLDRGQNF